MAGTGKKAKKETASAEKMEDLEGKEEINEEATSESATDAGDEEAPVEEIKEEKNKSEGDVDFKAKFYYLAAEMDNLQKRNQRDRENLVKYGNEKILTDLISVIDNFERTIAALKHDNDDKVKNIVTGIEMIRGQFLELLKKYGLTPVESLGKSFDPNFHEAVSKKEVEGKEENEVLEEFQRGYVLNGRLLRASMVVVNSK